MSNGSDWATKIKSHVCVCLLCCNVFCLYSGLVHGHGCGQRPITGRIHFGDVCPGNKPAGEGTDLSMLYSVVCLCIILFRNNP